MNHILKFAAKGYEDIEVQQIGGFISIFVDGRRFHDNEIMIYESHLDELIEALQKVRSEIFCGK